MQRVSLLTIIIFILMLNSLYSADILNVPFRQVPNEVKYVPNEFIVNFKPEAGKLNAGFSKGFAETEFQSINILNEKFVVSNFEELFPNAFERKIQPLSGYYRLKFDNTNFSLDEVLNAYKNDPIVEHIEKIGIHPVSAVPNDPYLQGVAGYQWYMENAGDHDVDATAAWDLETGDQSILVGVLDTGVRYFHKDIGGNSASYSTPLNSTTGNMWINSAEYPPNGIDDDSNGYVDDWVGWDFVDGGSNPWPGEDADTQDNDPRDFNGHGTHCAGVIGAISNNDRGIAGLAGGWGDGTTASAGNGVKVMALRIGWSGTYIIWEAGYVRMDFAAQAFYYAADQGVDIASCSWGSSNSGGIDAAVNYFIASGGMIFKAAGNSDNETSDYLTDRADVIAVAATDSNDVKADFSSYGTWVDISAPGVDIISLYHDHDNETTDVLASLSGTSMATPLTAGLAALVKSQNPSWTRTQVYDQILTTSDPIDGLNPTYTGKLGAGRINAHAALGSGPPPAPTADFSGSPLSGNAPLDVQFTDLSTGSITSWSWDFGDGGNSTAQSPAHQYVSPGNYTVTLTVNGPGGSDSEIKSAYITVNNFSVPVADFSAAPVSGTAPLDVQFSDISSGNITSWNWDFGDGANSTQQNPSHQYATAGDYTVTLTVSGPGGSDSETKLNYISVTEPGVYTFFDDFNDGNVSDWNILAGNWSVINSELCVDFGNEAGILAPAGNFTDGVLEVDMKCLTGQPARNALLAFGFINAANYRVLEMDDSANFWRIRERVNGTLYTRAQWSRNVNTGQFYHAKLTIESDGNVIVEVDGATVGSYKFATAKTGQIGVGAGYSHSCFDNFGVSEIQLISADFSGTPTSGVEPLNVQFTDQSLGTVSSWAWDFGDGNNSTTQNPSHQYSSAGDYTVTLMVTGPAGNDSETKINYIHVDPFVPAPVAEFSATPLSGDAALNVQFSDLSTGAISGWFWEFGDGDSSLAQNPSHTYSSAGNYTVSLTVTGPGGSDSETKVDYIQVTASEPPPVADFNAIPTSGDAPLNVQFTDASGGLVTSWNWNFGDGNAANVQNPAHQYINPGVYTVSLTVSGPGGSDAETKVDYITVNETGISFFDDFNDGSANDWNVVGGTWNVISGVLDGNNSNLAAILSPVASFEDGTIEADLKTMSGQSLRNAILIFSYVNGGNYRVLVMNDNTNQFQLYDGIGGVQTLRQQWSRSISTNVFYNVKLTVAADGNVTVAVDGNTLGSYKFPAMIAGRTGVGANYSHAGFDNYTISGNGTLVAEDLFASGNTSSFDDEVDFSFGAARSFELSPNYPNPFNMETRVQYTLPGDANVRIEILDILGHRVATLVNGYQNAGYYTTSWNGTNQAGQTMSSGVYFLKMTAGEFNSINKIMLMK